MKLNKRILTFILVAVFLIATSVNVLAENSSGSKTAGTVTVESSGMQYPLLSEALANANTTDSLSVSGDVELSENLTLGKNIILKAADGGGRLFTTSTTDATVLTVDSGETLTLGSDSGELIMEGIHIKVSKGKLHMKDGIHIISNLAPLSIIEISGSGSSATFDGGVVENTNDVTSAFKNWYLVSVCDGATVDSISAGTFKGSHIAFNVYGTDTRIHTITGGKFSNSFASRNSEPCFKLYRQAHIDKISGGEFLSHRFGALQLESGASISEISGGTFKNPVETPVDPNSGAEPFFSGLVLYGRTTGSPVIEKDVVVDKISGGSFEGCNGVLAVGNGPNMMAKINNITGGKFIGAESAGLYFTQNSQVGLLSGNVEAKGNGSGIWNAGKIIKIEAGTYTGEKSSGLLNVDMSSIGPPYKYFNGEIVEISGGNFSGNKNGMKNAGKIGTVSGGTFRGKDYAVFCDDKTGFGTLEIIQNGNFYAENGECCIYLVSDLKLEPDLSDKQSEFGLGRYLALGGNPIFNNEDLVTFPEYKDPENEDVSLKYFMSHPDDLKADVDAFQSIGFRFLRQKIIVKYNYNIGETPDEKVGKYLNPGENVTIWKDTSEFGAVPDDYEFTGWNTEADGSGMSYSGGDILENITSDITLYAVWNQKNVDNPNTEDPNGGNGNVNPDPNGGNENANPGPNGGNANMHPKPNNGTENVNSDVPETSDSGMLFMFIFIMSISGLGLTVSVKSRIRKAD